MVPLITCEIHLSQYVCELVIGVNVFDLDFGCQIDSIKQPIKSNSVGSGNMSHCRTSSLYDHLDHCFGVFKAVRGLCLATGQYSSLCVSAVGLVLCGFDHMEVDEQDREQVDSERRERERKKTKQGNNQRSNM